MLTFSSIIFCVMLFVALMIPGFIMGKLGRIDGSAVSAIGRIISDIAMPALVFVKLVETDVTRLDAASLLICTVLPGGVMLTIYFISKGIFKEKSGSLEHRCAVFCSVFPNCGFVGIPLAAALFPSEPAVTLYVSLTNVVSSFLFLTLGMSILSGKASQKPTLKSILGIILRPVNFAVALGFLCSPLNLSSVFPDGVSYFNVLSQLTTPLAMTVLGFELSQMKLSDLFGDVRIYTVAAIRLILSPLISIAALLILKILLGVEISYLLMSGVFIAMAVSSAASAAAMARAHGINGKLAPAATVVNTILSIATLPLGFLICNALFA